jgi:flavin-dependent dehydrogenase
MSQTVAILGTGPSGLYLALLLAEKKFKVRLFDPKSPWDNPAGSGIPVASLQSFPHLEKFSGSLNLSAIRFLSPRGREARIAFPEAVRIALREELAAYLMERIKKKRVSVVAAKAERFEKQGERWVIQTREKSYEADFLVGADGAAGFVRKGLGLEGKTAGMTLEVSYRLTQKMEGEATIKFLEEMPGFYWALPLAEGSLVGLWATSRFLEARTLFEKADLMTQNLLQIPVPADVPRTLAHLTGCRPDQAAGDRWALIAEAAGLIDPLTHQGIPYGLQSAAILADCLQKDGDAATAYAQRLKKEILPALKKRSAWKKVFYNKFFLDWLVARGANHRKARRFLLQNGVSEILKLS